MGPSHPATHGTVKIMLEIDGEEIVEMDVQVGYLHRGFEKECESGTWYQAIPYTDRLNYNSAILANLGLLHGGREAARLRDPAPRPVGAHAGERALAHGRPPDPAGRGLPRARRDDAVPVRDRGARAVLGPAGDAVRRARHVELRPHRRPAARRDARASSSGSTRSLARIEELLADFDKVVTANRIFVDRFKNTGMLPAREAALVRRHRADAARRRRAARPAQGRAVPRVRRDRLRRADRHHRRQLRPLPGLPGGARAEHPHHARVHAGDREDRGRAGERRPIRASAGRARSACSAAWRS